MDIPDNMEAMVPGQEDIRDGDQGNQTSNVINEEPQTSLQVLEQDGEANDPTSTTNQDVDMEIQQEGSSESKLEDEGEQTLESQHNAATKIQARARGMHARRE
eukprot:324320-Hanusia_phi.AAC.1